MKIRIQLNFAEIILNLKQCSPHEFLGGVAGGISFISIVSPGQPTVRQTNHTRIAIARIIPITVNEGGDT